jgi:hypothetical protein
VLAATVTVQIAKVVTGFSETVRMMSIRELSTKGEMNGDRLAIRSKMEKLSCTKA